MGCIIQSEWIPIDGASTIETFNEMNGFILADSRSPVMCTVSVESNGTPVLGVFSIKLHAFVGSTGSDIPLTQNVTADGDYPISLDGYPTNLINLIFTGTGVGRVKFTVVF